MKRFLTITAVLVGLAMAVGVYAAATNNKAVTVGERATYDIYDEDSMSSNDAYGIPTQQSTKAYVDTYALSEFTKEVILPLGSFILEVGSNGSTVGSSADVLDESTAPGFEFDDKMFNLVWADGETSAISVTFRVPADYSGTPRFLTITTESESTTANQLDFDVYVNTSGSAADSSATGQTPVAVAGDTATPMVDTITVATDFNSLAAGDWVTLRLWRDDTADGTGDLELKGIVFRYEAD